MLRHKAFSFELITDGACERRMPRYAGCRRFVFNRALAVQKELYEVARRHNSYANLCELLTRWKQEPELAWLNDAPSQVLQQALKDLKAAFDGFFEGRAAYPKFKKKGQSASFRYPQEFKIDQGNARLFLPRLGWVRYRKSRQITGTPKSITVVQEGGKWHARILTELQLPDKTPRSTSMVGIDCGIHVFAALSDGSMVASISPLTQALRKLARLQRTMAKKVKFSSNWKKAKAAVARLHRRIATIRKDYLHKVSTVLSKNHACVVLEELGVRNMSRSAKGTVEQPGRNVKAKAGLNRAILDQGWSMFGNFLGYKLVWRGGLLLKVPAPYTSQQCSRCGYVHAQNRKGEQFRCLQCGHAKHAGTNAAKNIEAAGHVALACGEPVQPGRSTKQEPAEGTIQARA